MIHVNALHRTIYANNVHNNSLLSLRVRDGAVRHWATSRKFTSSIFDGVTGSFHCFNPSGATHSLTETRTNIISRGVKAVVA